jgi:sulfite reductase (NADPH) flavoprotein alpha-component
MTSKLNPLNEKQINALADLIEDIRLDQLVWLNGYLQGLSLNLEGKSPILDPVAELSAAGGASKQKLTVLYGTHTGRSRAIAEKLSQKAKYAGIEVKTESLEDYKPKQISSEKLVALVVSTHGEGEPPMMAEDFHTFITGPKAPKLNGLNYAVLALGDRSYKLFCQTGIDIDQAFVKNGATALLPLEKLDVDFEDAAKAWIDNLLSVLKSRMPVETSTINSSVQAETVEYSRKKPFYALVSDKVRITGRGSNKEVYHVELSLKGSGLTYEPGDAIGILANNPPLLVDEILRKGNFNPEEMVSVREGNISLREALLNHLEITLLTKEVIKSYAELSGIRDVAVILENEALLDKYLYGHDVLDLLEEFPYDWTARQFVDVLRNLPPRLYSVSSSQAAVGNEVHITVSAVRYNNKGRIRFGACSTYLADRIEVDGKIAVFIEKNPAFKLPRHEETPIIMIGAGTGIAPFRAFLQHREAAGMKGKTWLFFGERRFQSDFLYQVEWQKLLKNGYLEKLDLAFSRDQDEKIYVQHRLIEHQEEIYSWLQNGASLYLCGDMRNMARDVQKALVEIIATQGGLSLRKAGDYLKQLKKQHRYQMDVY